MSSRTNPTDQPAEGLLIIPGSVRFTVIVPAWNSLHFLRATIPQLLRAADQQGMIEICLVDNGSEDGTEKYVRDEYPSVNVMRISRSTIGRARNFGASVGTGEALCFIDADCLVADNYFQEAAALLKHSETSVVGNGYDLPDRAGWIESVWHRIHERPRSGPTRMLPGGNLIVRREAFDAIGGFDEGLTTGEDADLCQRLISAGFQPTAEKSLQVQHLGNPKTLNAFFRQHVWHSLGMFGRPGSRILSKPTLMTLTHLVFIAASLAWTAFNAVVTPASAALIVGSHLATPLASVSYRLTTRGGGVSSRTALFDASAGVGLYWIYFAARAWALALLATGRSESYSK